ncbi:MAG: hypothetical protein HY865_20105 [Chloroflexi bacterium]|nr:hypothetical protein [Chloroflexota bacterium]
MEWLDCDFDYTFGKGMDDESRLVDEGVKLLKQTMADEIAGTGANAVHVVPLSGGLDSRVILGGLLENLPSSQIAVATYGIPGAWDFEIAKKIAREFGLRHEVFNLLDEDWDVDHLLAAALRLRCPISVHQSYVRQKINNHFGVDCVYWSGFMGDVLGGADVLKVPHTDKSMAVKRHINIEPTPNYKDRGFEDALANKMLLEIPWNCLKQPKFTLDRQLYIGDRQRQLTRHITIIEGFNFKAPFLNKAWVNFMINVPHKWLFDKYLYKKIIKKGYERLSKFPSTATAGMPFGPASKSEIFFGRAAAKLKTCLAPKDVHHSHPRTNYINWTESLRHKGKLQDSVYVTLQDIKKRAILNENEIDTWWRDHLSRKADYTRLLMNLSSLELLLKAGVMT